MPMLASSEPLLCSKVGAIAAGDTNKIENLQGKIVLRTSISGGEDTWTAADLDQSEFAVSSKCCDDPESTAHVSHNHPLQNQGALVPKALDPKRQALNLPDSSAKSVGSRKPSRFGAKPWTRSPKPMLGPLSVQNSSSVMVRWQSKGLREPTTYTTTSPPAGLVQEANLMSWGLPVALTLAGTESCHS